MLLERRFTPELEYTQDRLMDSRVDLHFVRWVGMRPTPKLDSLGSTFIL